MGKSNAGLSGYNITINVKNLKNFYKEFLEEVIKKGLNYNDDIDTIYKNYAPEIIEIYGKLSTNPEIKKYATRQELFLLIILAILEKENKIKIDNSTIEKINDIIKNYNYKLKEIKTNYLELIKSILKTEK